MVRIFPSILFLWAAAGAEAAQGAAARRAAAGILRTVESRFAREAAAEGIESRLAACLERYGDDVASAVRRVGPRAGLEAVERHGPQAAGFLATWGDEGARLLSIEGPAAIRVASRHGREGVDLMVRHRGVAAPLIEEFGDGAVRALRGLTPDGAVALRGVGREVRASGRAAEILSVVERFGDRACGFLWRNKGTVFGAALLAAFLADPAPYLDGVRRLAEEPLARTASEAARGTDWTAVVLVLLGVGGAFLWLRRRAVAKVPRGA